MILPFQTGLRARITQAIEQTSGLAPADQPPIIIEYPPRRALGDLATTVAFELARRVRRPPRAIAQELVGAIGTVAGAHRIEAAPNGYINVYLDRRAFLLEQLHRRSEADAETGTARGPKIIVEHTAINPNKAAHVGHLRNVALGDALVRLLRFRGKVVEVQNYIDDTGVQVADVIVGFRTLDQRDLDGVRALSDRPRFDHYCWDLYARVTEWYEQDSARLKLRTQTLHDLERGDTEAAAMGRLITDRIVRCHLATMARLNVAYDLLTWEGDILRLEFWARAFELLKAAGAVFQQTSGKLAGCWVMRIEEDEAPEDESAADEGAEAREKVIVRSDRTVTYVGKDIAYQFWKFGLLGRDFYYRIFARQADGRPLWATSAHPVSDTNGLEPPAFGGAEMVYNVIDSRQSYLQQLLRQALAIMGYTAQAGRSIHFAYEMVALTHATARALGYAAGADDSRPFVEVSGRKGLGVKADDLLDRLEASALVEVAARHPDLDPAKQRRIARIIGTAAVRYFLIKYSRAKVIAFDINEALSFEGETGPYLQYAVVRANNIFHKLRERTGIDEASVLAHLPSAAPDTLTADVEGDEIWSLVLEASRLDEIADQAIRSLELAVLAKYMFGLAQAFNAFYHRYPILNEEREDVRAWRAATVAYFRTQMTRALGLMGCEVPPRM